MGIVRLRMRWDPKLGKLVEVPLENRAAPRVHIWSDLPAYTSPVDGRVVDGRRQRREDLKRNRARPYEGRQQEAKEAARHRAYADQRLDRTCERMAGEAWRDAPTRVRRILSGE